MKMSRYFMYDGLKHCCVEGDNIVNVFSFSKTYGMMGWRLGYVSSAFFCFQILDLWNLFNLTKTFWWSLADSLLTEIRCVRGRAFENSRQHPNLCFHNILAPASLASSALTANPPFESVYFFPLSSLFVYEYEWCLIITWIVYADVFINLFFLLVFFSHVFLLIFFLRTPK